MSPLTFYFDCSSPWTYLAFTRVLRLQERLGFQIDWRPILVGGVFNAVNQEMYETRANPNPRKKAYMLQDLQQWAAFVGVKIGWPEVFPVRAIGPMRAVLAAQEVGETEMVALARSLFEAYWGDLRDISDEAVLEDLITGAGLDPSAMRERMGAQAIKDRLRTNTDALIALGGFGAPTFVVGDTFFFGNDRLPLVEAALTGQGET